MTTTNLDALGAAKYISLTTYRKDGTPVATPVWLVREGAALLVITDPDSGKAKRLRNNPAVRVSPCDMRGRVKPDAVTVPATVEFLDEAGTRHASELISKRYGVMGKFFQKMNERKARKAGKQTLTHLGLRITVIDSTSTAASG